MAPGHTCEVRLKPGTMNLGVSCNHRAKDMQ